MKKFTTVAHSIHEVLNEASRDGILSLVVYIINKGPRINLGSSLELASEYGHLNVVKYLVEKGANIHWNDDEALRMASQYGHLEVVKYLIEKGADIHANDIQALTWAILNNHVEVVKYLIAILGGKSEVLKWADKIQNKAIIKYLRNL